EVLADPSLRLLGDRRGSGHLMPGPCERPRQRGPRTARPDYPDPQPGRMLTSSSLHEYRTAPSYAGQRPDKNSHPPRARIPSPASPGAAPHRAEAVPGPAAITANALAATRPPHACGTRVAGGRCWKGDSWG